jgi:phosphopantetheinyl transferase
MAHRILSEEEHRHRAASATPLVPNTADARIAPPEPLEDTLHLLRTWTRKEACLKALGVGLHREMDTLTLEANHARTASAHLATHGSLPKLGWADLPLPEDCAAWAACAWLSPGAQA